ncbi:type IV pilus biogenesis/stability protein PilW [Chitinimonas sp. BJB300]|uniref:type IV pilus biogenesis/stability protein PilW n=1 Tax=Chitinimonas sp. BJB300 TaxID=1559339 RepID=UPI000C0DF662|nr:type IV pilus biogenesis/stability protein PilW [Chitinimonas sp. BJB300]PHV13001.1 type IV pilus biogenesis/stability protein PilW [Chitinimonas sp. BJB300]TSJ88942.1 type IV pilus biogenesis/stability protein PilW [Chitinimonas sp. BJB300]
MKYGLIAALLLSLSVSVQAEDKPDRNQLPRLRTELAAGYYARGQYDVALQEIDKALDADSRYPTAYYVQGLVYSDLREFDKADKSFRRAISLDPEEPNANHNYAWFLCSKRKAYREAMTYFRVALKNPLYKTPERSQLQAGLCALKMGDVATGADLLRRAESVRPDDPQTLYGLALVAYMGGDMDGSRTLLSRVARLGGSPSPEVMWLNVRLEHRLGNADNAAGFGKELRTLFPDSEEAGLLASGKYD